MAQELKTPYISLADAEIRNAGDVIWDAASDGEKNDALAVGRYYLDSRYYVGVPFDEDDAPIAVQNANADLGKDYLNDPDTFIAPDSSGNLKSERSKADTVEYEVENFSPASSDPYPMISMMVDPYLIYQGANGAPHFVDR